MSEPREKSRVRTRSRAQSASDKEKFVLQQALAQGKNPEKVLKELREFKPVHHSSTVGSPASVQASVSAGAPEVDKTASVASLTSSEDEESPFEKTVVSAQVEIPRTLVV